MTLLSDSSASIQYEAFHVFKCFVVNPSRPAALDEMLLQNAPQLLAFLRAFKALPRQITQQGGSWGKGGRVCMCGGGVSCSACLLAGHSRSGAVAKGCPAGGGSSPHACLRDADGPPPPPPPPLLRGGDLQRGKINIDFDD